MSTRFGNELAAGNRMLRLPSAWLSAREFRQRGFIFAPGVLDQSQAAALCDRATQLARSDAVAIERTSTDGRLSYEVVTGDQIACDFPKMFALYESAELLEWIRAVTTSPTLTTSPHLRSSININRLRRIGQQYPWHRDAIPFTALFFLTTVAKRAGGQLLLRDLQGETVAIQPGAGDFVLMDGSRCDHAVAPLQQNADRISVPMVYPVQEHARPADLDRFLYGDHKRAQGPPRDGVASTE